MSHKKTPPSEIDALTAVTTSLKQARLRASPTQLRELVNVYTRVQTTLRAVREVLDPTIQPAVGFRPQNTALHLERDDDN